MFQKLGAPDSPGNQLARQLSFDARRGLNQVLSAPSVDVSSLLQRRTRRNGNGAAQVDAHDLMRTLNVALDVLTHWRMGGGVRMLEGKDQFAFYGRCRLVAVLAQVSYADFLAEGDLIWVQPKRSMGVRIQGGSAATPDFERGFTELKVALSHMRECEPGRHFTGGCADAASTRGE